MDRVEGEFDASVMAGILADDDDFAEKDEEDDEVVVLEAGQLGPANQRLFRHSI